MADGGWERPMNSFTPGPETQRAYRDALGSFGTGVAVITCCDAEGPVSIAANSFSSVSLDPPLVLWSPAVSSSRHDSFVAAKRFCIHILGADQQDICTAAARGGRSFETGGWTINPDGIPVLNNALVRLDCTHHAAHGAGDHTIVLGQVTQVTRCDGSPLLFVQGSYGGFTNAG